MKCIKSFLTNRMRVLNAESKMANLSRSLKSVKA